MRDKEDMLDMGVSPIISQYKALEEANADVPPIYNDGQLINENVWNWALKTLATEWTTQFAPYPTYNDPETNNGIFEIQKASDQQVSIAILGDWASDTADSQLIAQQAGIQDYSIHLGDTYFVGSESEIKANFFPENGGTWPYGMLGSFAMLGNHEMYSGGSSYFNDLLPRMGNYQATGNQVQQASFFCLENEYWRVIGLDTGYESLTYPLKLTQNANLDITPEQKAWLQNIVKLNDDNRGLIFLSHHQCFSAFEPEFPNPMSSISTLMNPGRDIIWIWGHEHWMSVYGPNKLHNGANIYARCLGNSGMPVELQVDGGVKRPKNNDPSSPENRNLVLFDQRLRETINGNIPLGHNGYAVITLQADTLAINYYDDNGGSGAGRLVLEEHWSIDDTTGKLTGVSITDRTIIFGAPLESQLSWFLGAELTDAVGLPRPPGV
jgi:hypothetical protein